MENRVLIRVLLIGSPKVGKTCLMLRYTDNPFLYSYVRTIAIDCRSKSNLIQGKLAKICIFDPPGEEDFSTLTPAYWHLSEIIVFVASFGEPESLDYVAKLESIIFSDTGSEALKIILVNKEDLKESLGRDGHEFEEKARIWADSQKVRFFTCSARNNINVTEPIDSIINEFAQKKYPKDNQVDSGMVKGKLKCEIV